VTDRVTECGDALDLNRKVEASRREADKRHTVGRNRNAVQDAELGVAAANTESIARALGPQRMVCNRNRQLNCTSADASPAPASPECTVQTFCAELRCPISRSSTT